MESEAPLGQNIGLYPSDETAPRGPRHDHHPRAGRPQGPAPVRRPAGASSSRPPRTASGSTPWNGNSSGNCSAWATPCCRPSSPTRATATSVRRSRRPRATPYGGCPERHDRRYVSIFGELTIDRVVYGTREGQKIERVPAGRAARPARGRLLLRAGGLEPAALPEGVVRRGGPFAGDAPGPAAGDPALEQMNRAVAEYAPAFRASLESRRLNRGLAGRVGREPSV